MDKTVLIVDVNFVFANTFKNKLFMSHKILILLELHKSIVPVCLFLTFVCKLLNKGLNSGVNLLKNKIHKRVHLQTFISVLDWNEKCLQQKVTSRLKAQSETLNLCSFSLKKRLE